MPLCQAQPEKHLSLYEKDSTPGHHQRSPRSQRRHNSGKEQASPEMAKLWIQRSTPPGHMTGIASCVPSLGASDFYHTPLPERGPILGKKGGTATKVSQIQFCFLACSIEPVLPGDESTKAEEKHDEYTRFSSAGRDPPGSNGS